MHGHVHLGLVWLLVLFLSFAFLNRRRRPGDAHSSLGVSAARVVSLRVVRAAAQLRHEAERRRQPLVLQPSHRCALAIDCQRPRVRVEKKADSVAVNKLLPATNIAGTLGKL